MPDDVLIKLPKCVKIKYSNAEYLFVKPKPYFINISEKLILIGVQNDVTILGTTG